MNTSQITDRITARDQLRLKPLVACLILPLAATGVTYPSIAAAATLLVTNCNDSGSGSLREILASAQSGDTVDLRSLACDRVPPVGGVLSVAANDLVLQGPGAGKLTIPGISHTGVGTLRVDSVRIADGTRGIVSNGSVSLDESIVTGCSAEGIRSNAGLVMRNSTVSNNGYTGVSVSTGDTQITGSTISGNRGGYCGALTTYGVGKVRIENTTISGNSGAWAACISASTVTVANSTVAFSSSIANVMTGYTSVGLTTNSPELHLESSIFANNSPADLNVSASTVISGHNNLIMLGAIAFETGAKVALPVDTLAADPLLDPLANNGGPTMTHALRAGSPAIDAGNNNAALASDQRGSPFLRIAGPKPDIGAFESQPAPLNGVSIGPGFTGSWFDPAQSGHGLMLEVLSDHRLLAMWFAFNPEGNQQAWFGGVGTYSGNTATISDVALPTGGRWIPNFNPDAIERKPWGTLTLTFSDCNHGKVDFSSVRGYGSGSMNLLRLTQPAGLTCP
jgi:hypothetical protein